MNSYFYQPVYYDVPSLRTPGYDAAAPRPLFYGLWAFAEAAPVGSTMLGARLVSAPSPHFSGWALAAPGAGGPRTAVLLHKDEGLGAVTLYGLSMA